MRNFIQVHYFDYNNELIARLVNTLHIFDVVQSKSRKGALIRFVPTNDYERDHPVSFEAIETYDEVVKLIEQLD